MQTGLVFNIQKYSVQDGPGIRTTVFLKGCPMNCFWCHNPEGRSPKPEIMVVENRCVLCEQCRDACPFHQHQPGQGPLPPRNAVCILCGSCTDACPTEARQFIGQEMSVPQVMEEVLKDRIFYEDSDGGVTISGGEPLMQAGFLRALLQACRDQDLHTAVDTCGFALQEQLLDIAPLTDLFLYDVKFMDDQRHLEHTGVSNTPILDNLRALGKVHPRIWIRLPLLPGLNDDPAELNALARLAQSIPGVRQVNLLPYHQIGIQKLNRLGQAPARKDLAPPSTETMNNALAILREAGVEARVGG